MVCCHLVHVACGVEVALSVVEWPVGGAFFGVCAVPGFAEVLCAVVDVAERGFDGALVCVGCAAVGGVDCFVPFVVYEAGAGAAHADGDCHGVVVADVAGEVGALLVGEGVPRVGERLHDCEVCGTRGESDGCFGDLVDLGGVHGWVSFSVVVGVFSCVGFSVAHVWACVLAQSRERWRRALWGVSREERPVVRGRGLLVACVGVCGLRFLGVAGGYWRVVGGGVCLPLFRCCWCSPGLGGERKVAAWGECLVFSFCVKGVVSGGCEVACEW